MVSDRRPVGRRRHRDRDGRARRRGGRRYRRRRSRARPSPTSPQRLRTSIPTLPPPPRPWRSPRPGPPSRSGRASRRESGYLDRIAHVAGPISVRPIDVFEQHAERLAAAAASDPAMGEPAAAAWQAMALVARSGDPAGFAQAMTAVTGVDGRAGGRRDRALPGRSDLRTTIRGCGSSIAPSFPPSPSCPARSCVGSQVATSRGRRSSRPSTRYVGAERRG